MDNHFELPHVGDLVDVKVTNVSELGYFTNIIRFNLEGFILLTEIPKKKGALKIGGVYKAVVTRCDYEKSYFDLSIKRV
jgi:translation initiation factor 2 alpha subunit (eIF-2alpha)